jgi:hypothetical protein
MNGMYCVSSLISPLFKHQFTNLQQRHFDREIDNLRTLVRRYRGFFFFYSILYRRFYATRLGLSNVRE